MPREQQQDDRPATPAEYLALITEVREMRASIREERQARADERRRRREAAADELIRLMGLSR